MGDVKFLLKEARTAIKDKNYEASLKLCKQILKDDRVNYTALVFLGVSYQETGPPEKALSAFKKAITVSNSNPLAWNGLANYYEKLNTEDAKIELFKVYTTLLNIELSERKLIEYSEKLVDLQKYGSLNEIVQSIYSVITNKSFENIDRLWVFIVNLLTRNKNIPDEIKSIYEKALDYVLNNQKTVCIEYYAEYLNLLYQKKQYEKLLEHGLKMHSLFETDLISLKWICKVFNEIYVDSKNISVNEDQIQRFSERLLKFEPSSATALFTKSILLIEKNKLVEAKVMLDKAVALVPALLHAWILLLTCCAELYLLTEVNHAFGKIDKLLQAQNTPDENLKNKINILVIRVLSKSTDKEDLNKVLELYGNITDESSKSNTLQHVIKTYINLNKYTQAKLLLGDLKSDLTLHKLLSAQLLHKQEKYSEALALLDDEDVNLSEWWMEIGNLYWDMGLKEKSLVPFLKAAKLEPSNYRCFLLLGHYYKFNVDFEKARRCYFKAFEMNPKSTEAGIELSVIYRKLKNWEANLSLLQSLTNNIISAKNAWAWMQLGLHFLEQRDFDKAIINLRLVIRVEETNTHCWESLADAYLEKGAYMSSIKCYEKAAELSPNSLYPLLQMAAIKQILGEFVESRADFQKILILNQFYVPALKGIAETSMLQARDCYRSQRYGTSRDYTQFAAEKLIIAIQQSNNLACLWSLLGDCCYFITDLPEQHCCLLLPLSFVQGKQLEGNRFFEKDDLFTLAIRCYCKSLALIDSNVASWHNLTVCYLSQARNAGDEDLFTKFINKAQVCAQHCIASEATNWHHWNLLGNVALHLRPLNCRLAQHCFIKACLIDNNSAVVWCNLGTLYFILNDFKLANDAFYQAQRSDPNYVNSWIGQALLAESMGSDDAMDLFRHSTQLRMHQQGALGYGNWVCRTLEESPANVELYCIHNMHAIPVACDVLTWYLENNPKDGSAWNMIGIVKERLGLNIGALEAFRNTLALSSGQNQDLARVNYGRLLGKNKKYTEAVNVLSKVKTLTFNSAIGLALNLFKDSHYKESYEAYESVLNCLTDKQEFQSDLLVALASMAYMFQGPNAAKTLLFQSIQLKEPSPWSFFATLSLGLLHKDLNLAQLVYNEIDNLKDKQDCIHQYALLSGYLYLLQKEPLKAIKVVSKIVHRHPDQASVWLTLSIFLMRDQKDRNLSKAAARCAHIAMKLGQTSMDVTKVMCLVSLSSLIAGDNKNALLAAQKAIHCYPNVAEGWAVFASVLLVTSKVVDCRIKDTVKHVKTLTDLNTLKSWTDTVLHSLNC